ncbi:winged helix DNA-binding domain-containing protein [Phytomonospora sp. NPDC050363]|uniref:winged helix DNA-binding domain-containing protein n=1 Tax=Phytomonospora sp. NPDC050363 TaxID=3155642 RepID=UPI0033EE5A96
MTLTWSAISARRLDRNGLGPTPGSDPASVVAAMCGAHAQVLSAGEHSIGLRLPGSVRAEVRSAIWDERALVKTHGPRGTVHLLPSAELPMWIGALAGIPDGRVNAGLAPGQVDEIVAAVGRVLADTELTIDELDAAVVAETGPWAGDLVMPGFNTMWPRWRQALSVAGARGALCFGPNRGRKVTYTDPHRWLPGFTPMPAAHAHAELLARYLHAYGPATPQHFARWIGAKARWAAELFTTLASRIEAVELDGETMWVNAGDTDFADTAPEGVRLLPYFDAYGIACQPRERLFPGRAFERALARGQAGNFPILLIDGAVAGVWHQKRSGRKAAVTVEALGELTARQVKGVEEQVERNAEFHGGTATLTFGEINVGGHA